jgi:hypothetical protein
MCIDDFFKKKKIDAYMIDPSVFRKPFKIGEELLQMTC